MVGGSGLREVAEDVVRPLRQQLWQVSLLAETKALSDDGAILVAREFGVYASIFPKCLGYLVASIELDEYRRVVVENLWDEMMGLQKITSNMSEHYEPTLQTNRFMNGLRTGGPSNDFLCDAFVLRSGEPFANGMNYLEVAFSQKG